MRLEEEQDAPSVGNGKAHVIFGGSATPADFREQMLDGHNGLTVSGTPGISGIGSAGERCR